MPHSLTRARSRRLKAAIDTVNAADAVALAGDGSLLGAVDRAKPRSLTSDELDEDAFKAKLQGLAVHFRQAGFVESDAGNWRRAAWLVRHLCGAGPGSKRCLTPHALTCAGQRTRRRGEGTGTANTRHTHHKQNHLKQNTQHDEIHNWSHVPNVHTPRRVFPCVPLLLFLNGVTCRCCCF